MVANPSSMPEAVHGAAALAGAGLLERYHAPLTHDDEYLRRVDRLLPARVSGPIMRELRRRRLPTEVSPAQADSVGALSDLVRVALQRLSINGRPKLRVDRWVIESFDRGVASALGSGDGAVHAMAGFGLRTTAAARDLGVTSIIGCPIGHHAFVREIMQEESRLQPEWAGTLQGHDFPDWWIDAHVRELETADHVIALSRFSAQTLTERGVPEEKIHLTHLGVDTQAFRPGSRQDDGVFRVILAGQITQRKGLSYLVEGFERAQLERSELVLLGNVIGDASPWAGRPNVIHVPPMPRVELPPHYQRSDVYVLPSLAEGFPLTAMEAMACGLPVIVSTNSFADEVIDDGVNGFIVPIRDADAIAERLRVLAADPDLRARMGAEARRTAERFDWSRYRERIVGLMRGILASVPQRTEKAVRSA